jgi:hypothetical protein
MSQALKDLISVVAKAMDGITDAEDNRLGIWEHAWHPQIRRAFENATTYPERVCRSQARERQLSLIVTSGKAQATVTFRLIAGSFVQAISEIVVHGRRRRIAAAVVDPTKADWSKLLQGALEDAARAISAAVNDSEAEAAEASTFSDDPG